MVKVTKFGAEWCAPCRALKPIWEKLAAELTDVEFQIVDIDEDSEAAQAAGVTAVPTIIVEKDGEEVDRVIGLLPEAKLRGLIENA